MAFQTLLTLRLTHTFFDEAVCTTLALSPSEATGRLLRHPALVLRGGDGDLRVLADTDGHAALPTPMVFDFVVHARDATSHNYTEGLPTEAARLVFLSNETPGLPTDGRLSRSSQVGEDDACAWADLPPEFQPPLPGTVCAIRLTITDPSQPMAYHAGFAARRTIWQYFISGPQVAGQALTITSHDQKDLFAYCGEVALPNGRMASHFRSHAPMALRHRSPQVLSLRDKHNARLVLKRLPTPSSSLLMREHFDGEEALTSQMFVNL